MTEPEPPQEFSFFSRFGEKLAESSGLFMAVFFVLITNILFQASDSRTTKSVLSLTMGILILGFLFSYNICHSLIIVCVVYGLTRLLKKRAPSIVVLFTISYVFGYHNYIEGSFGTKIFTENEFLEPLPSYNLWGNLYKFSLIPLICKCISFSLCYADSFKSPEILSIDQTKRKIESFPSSLDYLSYMFHYLSVFLGPPLDYYDYNAFMNADQEYHKYERNIRGTFLNLFYGSLAFLFYVILTCSVDPLIIYNKGLPEGSSILDQVYIVCAVGLLSRLFYYCFATFSQAGLELSGLSYNGMDSKGKIHFGRVKVINASFLLEKDTHATIQSWNPSYYVWLKKYIYVRVFPLQSIRKSFLLKCITLAIALGTSFILFGLPVGGLIAYAHLFLLILVSAYEIKGRWRLKNLPKLIRASGSVLKWAYVYFAFSIFIIGIQIKDLEVAKSFYTTVGYIPIIINACLLSYFLVAGWDKEEPKASQKTTGTGEENEAPSILDETEEYLEEIRRKLEYSWNSMKKSE